MVGHFLLKGKTMNKTYNIYNVPTRYDQLKEVYDNINKDYIYRKKYIL